LLACALIASLCGCAVARSTPFAVPASARSGEQIRKQTLNAASAPVLAAYWESWDDTDSAAAFGPLASVPAAVNVTEVADFEIDNGHGALYEGPYNAHSLQPGAEAIHARGGKVLLSIGGYGSQWGIPKMIGFTNALARVLAANPGVFDGFDFDDENIPWQNATPRAGQAEIVRAIEAVHARYPSMLLSYTAFVMGASLPPTWNDDQGEDVAVLRQVGNILTYVNVMEYTQYSNNRVWKPPGDARCEWNPHAAHDCYLETLATFAALPLAAGGRLGAAKILMGLEIHPEQPQPAALTPAQMLALASWVRTNGYAGVAVWSIDRDCVAVSGYPLGSFTDAIAGGLRR
jgi:hypothetical protein